MTSCENVKLDQPSDVYIRSGTKPKVIVQVGKLFVMRKIWRIFSREVRCYTKCLSAKNSRISLLKIRSKNSRVY